jgi:N-acetylmuramoyl-L-alanine amidase
MKYLYVLFFISLLTSCNKKQVKEEIHQENEVKKDAVIKIKEVITKDPVLIFTVQIAALSNKNEDLANLNNVKYYYENGLIKYRFGAFESYKEARRYRVELLNDYEGAFVQALKNGEPIHIKQALSN